MMLPENLHSRYVTAPYIGSTLQPYWKDTPLPFLYPLVAPQINR